MLGNLNYRLPVRSTGNETQHVNANLQALQVIADCCCGITLLESQTVMAHEERKFDNNTDGRSPAEPGGFQFIRRNHLIER